MKPLTIILSALLLIIGTGLFVFGIYTRSSSPPVGNAAISNVVPERKAKPDPLQVNIPFAVPWTNANVDVSEGQTLTITASGRGVWKNVPKSANTSYPSAYEECDPNGTAPVDKADYLSNISLYQCPQAYKGALIGKIGDGEPFLVGTRFTNRVTQSGLLYLGINDMRPDQGQANWADNSGSFTATVSLK